MSFRGGNRGGGWRGGRGGSREAHKPPPAKKVRTEVRTHYMFLRILNLQLLIQEKKVVFFIKMSVTVAFIVYFDTSMKIHRNRSKQTSNFIEKKKIRICENM